MSFWEGLKKFTSARVGLGRAGHAQPTKVVLAFQQAHAEARSAVLQKWNPDEILQKLDGVITVTTQALNREDYLKFPNKGRALSEVSKEKLSANTKASAYANTNVNANTNATPQVTSVVFIIADGLSAKAIDKHFLNLWSHFIKTFQTHFAEIQYKIVLTPFARVAVSDEIGELLKAHLSVIFIGERPGLNSSDSLGIYLTYNPKKGNSDANRNCISNVRPPLGLSYEVAALKLNYLLQESLRRQLSGVQLKDECFIDSKATPKIVY